MITARERQILHLICRGLSDPDIAAALELSPNTIRNHVASLYRKLHVHRRSALVIWAFEHQVAKVEKATAKTRATRKAGSQRR
jgi:DNA-binding NarL/FixJ family response regulator